MTALTLAGLGAMTSLLCILLAVFLLASGGRLAKANRYLAGFLFLTAIDLSGLMGMMAPEGTQALLAWRSPLSFLQMPLFYAYMVLLCRPSIDMRPHGAAALAIMGLTVLDMALRTGGSFPGWATAALHFQFYGYLALSAHAAWRLGLAVRENRSSPQDAQLLWMWAVIGTSFFAHNLVVFRSLASGLGWPVPVLGVQLVITLIALGILCAMTMTALLKPSLFKPMTLEEARPAEPPRLTPDMAALAERLEAHMAREHSYLDPSLTLKGLARRLSVGERELSTTLNHQLGQHFFDFVNQCRIRHAQALILEDQARSRTLLDIAYASGFNSKSSFNTAFRKHAGQTPSAFRARVEKDGV